MNEYKRVCAESPASEDGVCGICWLKFAQCACSWQLLKQRADALAAAALTYKHRARERRRGNS